MMGKRFVSYAFMLVIVIFAASCDKRKPAATPTCSNGLDYKTYNDCKCPEGQYQLDGGWDCRVIYDPKNPHASNGQYIVGNIPSGFFEGHGSSVFFHLGTYGDLMRGPTGDSTEVFFWLIENGMSVKRLPSIYALGYYKPVQPIIYPETFTFVIDLKQLAMGLGYNGSGESLMLTGTFIEENGRSRPKDDWKWNVVAANDTSLTPTRSYPD